MDEFRCYKCGKQAACLYTDSTRTPNEQHPYCIDCIFEEHGSTKNEVSFSVELTATPQPPPKGIGNIVLPFVIDSLKARAEFGFNKYGTYLRTHNGRDALMDAYQESLDLCVYLAQAIMERDQIQKS